MGRQRETEKDAGFAKGGRKEREVWESGIQGTCSYGKQSTLEKQGRGLKTGRVLSQQFVSTDVKDHGDK